MLAMGSRCPLCLSVQGWGKMHSWRAVRNIFIKVIQPEPSLAPSTVSQMLSKQKKSDRNNLKRKMKPRRGWWLKSLLQCTSRKRKEAEMQIYPGDAGPGVRRPIKAHPLNPLHLSLPICSRSWGSKPERVKAISNCEAQGNRWWREPRRCKVIMGTQLP